MQFQGFAREERLSDNQIRIDINSVIENDLAEANRQTKYLGRNTDLEGQWGNLYLNKLIKKHEVEKRNREENFASFMKNREEINKIVQYNNEIKYKDAGVNRHVEGLDSILGKGLLQLAVNVGSAAIKGAIARSGDAEAEAEKETLDFVKITSLKASKAQNELRRNPDFIQRVRSDVEGVSKAAIAEYNLLGDHKAGINFAQNIYRAHKLDIVDRHNTFHSERLTAIAAQTSLEEFTWNSNGAEITWNDIQAGRYPNAEKPFLDEWEKSFYKERGIHDVGVGAQARAALGIHSVVSQAQRIIKNNQYKRDTKDYEIQLVSTLESHTGSTSELIQFVTDPNGTHIGSRKTRGEALEWLRNHWENYGSSQQIREAMTASFPGVESINEGAPSERHPAGTKKWQDWNSSLAAAVAREEQGHVNTQAEYDGNLRKIEGQITNPQIARTILQFIRPGGELHEKFSAASPGAQAEFLETVRGTAGYGGEAPTITAGQKAVNDQITNTEATNNGITFIKEMGTGKEIALDGIPTADMNSLKGSIADTYRAWASDLADQLIASGVRPEDVEAEINAIVRTDDPRTDPLKKALQARWTDPNATDPDKRLLVPQFPYMRKPISKDAKGFTQSYDEAYWAAQKEGQRFTLAQADLDHPVVERWLKEVDKAKRYKHIDLQNVLSNPPKEIRHIMRTQKFSTPGQVYQAALDNVEDYGDKYTRLSESDYMDYNEVQQQYNVLGAQFSKLDERAKAVVLARQEANGGRFPLNADAARTTQPSTPGARHPIGHLTYKGNEAAYVTTGKFIKSLGFNVSEQAAFGGVTPNTHTPDGFHPHNEAFDITHQTGDYNESVRLTKRLKEAFRKLGLFHEIIGPGDGDPKHKDHLHAGGLMELITADDQTFIQNHVFGGN